jgi:multisubunit Na+/H+ antiporter MnhG subunit
VNFIVLAASIIGSIGPSIGLFRAFDIADILYQRWHAARSSKQIYKNIMRLMLMEKVV